MKFMKAKLDTCKLELKKVDYRSIVPKFWLNIFMRLVFVLVMTYEFDDDEAEKLWIFGNQIMIVSAALFIIGVFGIVTNILAMVRGVATVETTFRLIEFAIVLGISILLFRPSDNFKRISTSEGRDIDELMIGIKEFNLAFMLISSGILIIALITSLLILRGG